MRGYLENQPSRRQQRWAEQFWTFEAETSGEATILPDARSDLILRFQQNGERITNVRPIVSLPMISPYHIEYKADDCWIGVRLKPEQTSAIKQLVSPLGKSATLSQADADRIFAPVIALAKPIQTCAHLRKVLDMALETLSVTTFPNWVRSTIDRFHLSGGRVRISDRAGILNISERHFRREFMRAVHVSPKAYCSIIRFHRALRLIVEGGLSISDAAFETGYADHSHLTRAFSKMGGFSPSNIPPHLSLPGLPIN